MVLWLLFACLGIAFNSPAQTIVNLNASDNKNKQSSDIKLYDNFSGNFLLNLKLTFHITNDNILFMIVGDEKGINDRKAIWMFDKNIDLDELRKKNKNLIPSKEFKKAYNQVEQVLVSSTNVAIYVKFQNDYEYVQSVPKPVFLRVKDRSIPVELKLKFYMSEMSDKDQYSQILTAQAGIAKITININK